MDTLWLNLNKEPFDQTLKQAKEDYESSYGVEDSNPGYLWEQLELSPLEAESVELEDGFIVVNCDINSSSFGNIGCMMAKVRLTDSLAIEIIQEYIKKMNKIKTVLEATK